jgi:catechol 2,3-dioxygenase-like lactoylglutathione lyase family enzyme
MLTETRTTTVLPVSDMDRASRFYTDQLGLKGSGDCPTAAARSASPTATA